MTVSFPDFLPVFRNPQPSWSLPSRSAEHRKVPPDDHPPRVRSTLPRRSSANANGHGFRSPRGLAVGGHTRSAPIHAIRSTTRKNVDKSSEYEPERPELRIPESDEPRQHFFGACCPPATVVSERPSAVPEDTRARSYHHSHPSFTIPPCHSGTRSRPIDSVSSSSVSLLERNIPCQASLRGINGSGIIPAGSSWRRNPSPRW